MSTTTPPGTQDYDLSDLLGPDWKPSNVIAFPTAGPSALDHNITVSYSNRYPDPNLPKKGDCPEHERYHVKIGGTTLRKFAARLKAGEWRKAPKEYTRMVKLGRMTGAEWDSCECWTGVMGDYDAGVMPKEEAAELARKAGIGCMFYDSPSHGIEGKHKWRVTAVTSATMKTPEDMYDQLDRLNGALGGILGVESWDRGRRYHFGKKSGTLGVITVDGDFIDKVSGIVPARHPSANTAAKREYVPVEGFEEATPEQCEWAEDELRKWADRLTEGEQGDRHKVLIKAGRWSGGAVARGFLDQEQVEAKLLPAAIANGMGERRFRTEFPSSFEYGLRRPITDFLDENLAAEFDDLDVDADGLLILDDTPKSAKAIVKPLPPSGDWKAALMKDKDEAVKKTAKNVRLIIENDELTAGIFALNELHHRIYILKRPGVKMRRGAPIPLLEGDHWNPGLVQDIHDAEIRDWLSGKGILGGWSTDFSRDDIRNAIEVVAQKNSFHPIRDRLRSFSHDGKPRAETIFIDYLGTPDTPYFRGTARYMLLGAVARVFEPGCKFDFMTVIEGKQGIRKSTFVKRLALDWYGEPALDWESGKEIIEQTQGYWFVEIPELSGLNKGEINAVKANLTRTSDRARLSYGHHPVDVPRQCIFVGSTNDRDYLRDPTGDRRYWPIPATVDSIDTDKLEREAPQIWAEVVGWYDAMRAAQPHGELWLDLRSEQAKSAALSMQASRKAETPEDIEAGRIGVWFDTPITVGQDDMEPDAPKVLRQATCTGQIWKEMYGKEGPVPHAEATKIGRALRSLGLNASDGSSTHPALKEYGRCRVYTRVHDVHGESTA